VAPRLRGALYAALSSLRVTSGQQPFHRSPQSGQALRCIGSRQSCAEKLAKDLFLFQDSELRFAKLYLLKGMFGPPPMKWSDSKYGFATEEDCNGEEAQA
jgi:hypothetical protein